MRYRILVETEKSGKKFYYVQERYMMFFWKYVTDCKDYKIYGAWKIGWDCLEDAKKHIKEIIKNNAAENLKKIVKRNILKEY